MKKEEDTIKGEYELCQRNFPFLQYPRGEQREALEQPGVFAKVHTQVHLGEKMDKDTNQTIHDTSFNRVAARVR